MPRVALTDLTLRSLKAEKRTDFWDNKTPSFGVRVGALTKTFIVKRGGSRIALGSYPDMSLQEARRRALAAKSEVASVGATITFPRSLELFLAQDRWKPSSRYQIERTLHRYCHWQKTVDKITHNDVAQVIDGISAKHEASHVLKDIRAFFNWCIPRYIKINPCVGMKAPAKYVPRDRVLSDAELKAVWKATAKAIAPFGDIIKLLILTGQRKTEIGTLRWSYIKENQITLPETKNGRAHTFPLSKLSTSLFSSRTRSSDAFVFPASRMNGTIPYMGWGKHLKELQALSKTSGWTLHDLRRTFATNLAALGTPIHITERLLNHVSGTQSGIVAVYQRHDYAAEMREAVNKWEKKLASVVR